MSISDRMDPETGDADWDDLAIAAAFGCGDGIDTTPERVHETPNREHIEEVQ